MQCAIWQCIIKKVKKSSMQRVIFLKDANLLQTIENLRRKMIQLANEKQTFLDPEVITLSQQLDKLVVQAQRKKNYKIIEAYW